MWLGVDAEQKPLEEIATPLTAEDADQHPAATGGTGTGPAAGQQQRRRRGRIEPALTPQAPYRLWSPMAPVYAVPIIDLARDREVDEIVAALGAGPLERRRLARLVRADLWGPGRFSSALRAAAVQGKVRRTGRSLYALAPGTPDPVKTHDPVTGLSAAMEPGSAPEPDVIPIHPAAGVTNADRPDGPE